MADNLIVFDCQFVNRVEVDCDTACEIWFFAEWHVNETDCSEIGARLIGRIH